MDWQDKYTKYFFYFLAGLGIFRFIYLFFLPLIPQEAYYWYYAQYPDFSYFDHPPLAAYSIWLGTNIFGDTVFGVKFMAVVWSLLTNFVLFKTVQRATEGKSDSTRLAFYSVLLYNLTVFAHLYSLLMVPDSPLIFFWLLAIFFFQEMMITKKRRYWLYTGAALGFGFISKYTIVALLPAFFLVMLLQKDLRRWFISPFPYLGILVMGLIIFPVFYWNQQHDWASFGFQFSERAAHVKKFQTKYIGQLIASQMMMLTPLVFVLFFRLGINLKSIWKKHARVLFFLLSGAFLIGGFTFVSLRSLVKMNWLLPGFIGLAIGTVLYFSGRISLRSTWMKIGITLSVVLIFAVHVIQLIPNMPLGEGNTWSGWQDASDKIYTIQQELGGESKNFIFANSYKSASLLKFYLPDHQNTYAQNIYNRPALQFDIWGKPDSLAGKDALYIFTDRREYKKDLKHIRPFFESVEPLREFNYQFIQDIHTRTIYCYYAKNYSPVQK